MTALVHLLLKVYFMKNTPLQNASSFHPLKCATGRSSSSEVSQRVALGIFIDDGAQAVFKGWESDDYTSFYASIVHHAEVDEWDEDIVFAVESFYKEYEEFARGFIVDAEEHYNGKYNPETLQVEPVKPECPFKPFDKVLVRCGNGIWGATFFSRCDKESTWTYVGVDCNNWEQCIPYNERTAHLLGTADPYTEGGSE